MSLANLCNITTATIQRVASTNDTAMGQVRTYSTANRGSLPTTSTGRLNTTHSARRFAFEQHGAEVDGVWYTKTDPQCGVSDQDQLVIGSDLYLVQYQKNPDQVGKYYMLGLIMYGTGVQ